jgi:hypothetical protein
MSEEVALATADLATIAELQSQLGQAHADLLLAQANVEVLVTAIRAFFRAPTFEEAGRLRVELKELAREHPGTPLADEVRAARALTAQGKKLADAVQGYFNTIGTSTIDRRPERHEIYQMAEMLADYGVIEQQVKVGQA